MATVYESKIDAWLLIVLIAAMALSLSAVISALLAGGPGALWAVIPAFIGIGLPSWVLMTTRYTLDRNRLLVKSGPFRWSIPVAEISNIEPTSNPLSSPALSLDRLQIEYSGGRRLMISPKDKEAFLAELEEYRRRPL